MGNISIHSLVENQVKMLKDLAPVCLFAYKRKDLVKQTIEALQLNYLSKNTELIVFCDGARDKRDERAVQDVRLYLSNISGFRSVKLIERDCNYGLSKNIIDGVSRVLKNHNKVIVLEDDMETSSYFLKYMNDALNTYSNDVNVSCIHGYVYPGINFEKPFFLKGADCWGWATWKRSWDTFEQNASNLFRELKQKNLFYDFDYDGSYPYSKMLKHNLSGLNDSWAVRWYASCYLNDSLTLYPNKSLVRNIGHDNSGTHCSETDVYDIELSNSPILVDKINIEQSLVARDQFKYYFKNLEKNVVKKFIKKLRGLLSASGIIL
jgi:hypothetical protein